MNKSSTVYYGQTTLGFANYDFDKFGYEPDPKPTINAGLYGGEPFDKGAGWSNVPVTPSTDYMTNVNLISAHPPEAALIQYPHQVRPGNNYQRMEGVGGVDSSKHTIQCSVVKPQEECLCTNECECKKCYYRAFGEQ